MTATSTPELPPRSLRAKDSDNLASGVADGCEKVIILAHRPDEYFTPGRRKVFEILGYPPGDIRALTSVWNYDN